MAGLLYLPRIFVYHANPKILKETSQTFKIMEKRLYHFIMIPAAIITWFTGLIMIHFIGFDLWLNIKICFVIILSIFHLYFGRCRKAFEEERNTNSAKFYKIINEVPTILLILIVILVVFKPF
tara:strand:+ start:97 stop:465 length:369 start_codon:yes stop_codon:yes gene_type:complete